jgi:hypothetical protein
MADVVLDGSVNVRLDPAKEPTQRLRAVIPSVQCRLADSVAVRNRYLADLRTGDGGPQEQVDRERSTRRVPIEVVEQFASVASLPAVDVTKYSAGVDARDEIE